MGSGLGFICCFLKREKSHMEIHRKSSSVETNYSQHHFHRQASYDGSSQLSGIVLSIEDRNLLVTGWKRAMEHTDIGAELITRLMNDGESQLRYLLRTRSESGCAFTEPTMECKAGNLRLQCPRAAKLADLMTNFFIEVIEEIGRPGFSEERLSDKCWQLGATHYHKEVWFQEENWMHFHKAFVETIMFSDKHYQGYKSCEDFFDFKKKHNFTLHKDAHHCIKRIKYEEILWFKLIHFIVRNMKQGFLEEAIHSSIKGVPEVEKDTVQSPRHVTSKDTLLSDGLREDEDSSTESCLESDWRRKCAERAAAEL